MANEHSEDNIQCIYNIVASNLSNLIVQISTDLQSSGKMEYKVH